MRYTSLVGRLKHWKGDDVNSLGFSCLCVRYNINSISVFAQSFLDNWFITCYEIMYDQMCQSLILVALFFHLKTIVGS